MPQLLNQLRYTRNGLWTLFLICSFPLHVWTFILSFMDFSWVTERTNAWDALGVISYGLIFALIESTILFILFTLVGLLISAKWDEPRRITLLGSFVLVLSAWTAYSQAHFLWGASPPGFIVEWVSESQHPVRLLYLYFLTLVSVSMMLPAFLILRQDKIFKIVQTAFQRISFLTVFYLMCDVAALIIVLFRNIQ